MTTLSKEHAEWIEVAERLGHKLKRDSDGHVDYFAHEVGYHNGPVCIYCYDSWCWHCTDATMLEACPDKDKYK